MTHSRREMLRGGLGGLGAIALGGGATSAFALDLAALRRIARSEVRGDNILVVVQLTGGNDGLNTVVPTRDDAYFKARPRIAVTTGAHRLSDELSLNPATLPFKQLFHDGKLAIINGCGYPRPSRSHCRAMETWHTADPTRRERTGWLGRYVERESGGEGDRLLKAVNVGPLLPQALFTDEEVVPSIQSIEDLPFLADRRDLTRIAAATDRPDADYPAGLGHSLRLIAQLIRAELGTKVFYCQLAGFDTHANQPRQHERLLGNMASSISAFCADMKTKGYADNVLVVCFSEFGRRLAQNQSAGTDHGWAGPMFVVGEKVKGGLYGSHPSLTDLDDGDVKHTTDFRRVYATLLEKWLGADCAAVLKDTFEKIDFL